MFIKTVIDGTPVTIESTEYGNNGRLALQILEGHYSGIILTVNLPDEPLDEGEFFIKTWSENEDISAVLRQSGIFIDTGRRVATGFVQAEVWKFNSLEGGD